MDPALIFNYGKARASRFRTDRTSMLRINRMICYSQFTIISRSTTQIHGTSVSQTPITIMKTSTAPVSNPQYPILSNQAASIEDLQTTLVAKWPMQSIPRLQSDASSFQYQQTLAFTEKSPFKSKVYRSSHGTYTTTYTRKHIDETCRWSLGSSVDCHTSNRKSWLGISKVATQGE